MPAQLRVIVTVRPKYACRTCEAGDPSGGAGAPQPEPTEGALAQVLIAKYGALYRQSQIYARSGVELDARRLGGQGVFHLTPGI